ncbi:polymorphic toxin type 15 domain-containing protein [Vibrio diabolicus]|uniref:polymorphic toxin type 15 domain-containing protein n=2 Tax=Vibrio diabolicus TaxID=50719 RepID=UPI001C710A47|nr:polymorphic toxin type 15 domain-containing protein [Vibrio diabolicus]
MSFLDEFELGNDGYRCSFGNTLETCTCSTCLLHRQTLESQKLLKKSLDNNFRGTGMGFASTQEVEPVPKQQETPKEKYERQKKERHKESEDRWLQSQKENTSKNQAPTYGNDPDFIKGYVEHSKNRDLSGALSLTPLGTAMDTLNEGKEFLNNPTLSGAASLAVVAIPGKFADKVVDELPLKKLDSAMAKTLRTMKRFKVPCFKPGKTIKAKFKGRERELESHFARQLKQQEAGINDLTVGEYLENRQRYKEMKRAGTGLAQEDFRESFSTQLYDSLLDSYSNKYSVLEADQKATQRTTEIMKNLAALHDPDMIAGGKDQVSRMGNKSVNSSIGPQWQHKSRLKLMDSQAQQALEKLGPDAKMNVSLERCPLNGKK